MTIWEPPISPMAMKSATIRTVSTEAAKSVWDVDKFLSLIPEGTVKAYKAHVVGFNDAILPQGGIGVDPGLKLGLAVIVAEDVAHTISMYVERDDLPMATVLTIFHHVPVLLGKLPTVTKRVPVVVEGPAHNARYGQALLGEVRAALILGFVNAGYESVAEIPPLSIRKRAFGDGGVNPKEDVWPDLPPDSAAALSMAIAAGL